MFLVKAPGCWYSFLSHVGCQGYLPRLFAKVVRTGCWPIFLAQVIGLGSWLGFLPHGPYYWSMFLAQVFSFESAF